MLKKIIYDIRLSEAREAKKWKNCRNFCQFFWLVLEAPKLHSRMQLNQIPSSVSRFLYVRLKYPKVWLGKNAGNIANNFAHSSRFYDSQLIFLRSLVLGFPRSLAIDKEPSEKGSFRRIMFWQIMWTKCWRTKYKVRVHQYWCIRKMLIELEEVFQWACWIWGNQPQILF